MDGRTLDERVRRAVKVMESVGATSPVTEAALAFSAHLSVSRFAHLFREQTGMAPLQMLRLIKLKNATKLLLDTRLAIKEIGFLAGFGSPASFVRFFKRRYGMTPREYRRCNCDDRVPIRNGGVGSGAGLALQEKQAAVE